MGIPMTDEQKRVERIRREHEDRVAARDLDLGLIAGNSGTCHTKGVVSESKANEVQVGGKHYKTGGEEHWDRVHRLNLDYFQGQITKYVERCWRKNGVEDLRKARHFLDKYIELYTKEEPERDPDAEPTEAYVDQARDEETGVGPTRTGRRR